MPFMQSLYAPPQFTIFFKFNNYVLCATVCTAHMHLHVHVLYMLKTHVCTYTLMSYIHSCTVPPVLFSYPDKVYYANILVMYHLVAWL